MALPTGRIKTFAKFGLAVIAVIFVYNFVKSRWADDKLPDLDQVGKKK